MPVETYAQVHLRFARENVPDEAAIRDRIARHGFAISSMSYHLVEAGAVFEYRMYIKTLDRGGIERLAMELRAAEDLLEFRLSPTGE
jgi:putative Mg2+ transporter-C (MgtC) family protein